VELVIECVVVLGVELFWLVRALFPVSCQYALANSLFRTTTYDFALSEVVPTHSRFLWPSFMGLKFRVFARSCSPISEI